MSSYWQVLLRSTLTDVQQGNDRFSAIDSYVFFDLVKKLPTLVGTMYNYSTRFKIFTVMLLWIQDFLDSSQCRLVSGSY